MKKINVHIFLVLTIGFVFQLNFLRKGVWELTFCVFSSLDISLLSSYLICLYFIPTFDWFIVLLEIDIQIENPFFQNFEDIGMYVVF